MPIEMSEFHDEVVDEFVECLQKNPWNFAPGRGKNEEFRFYKQNKCKLGNFNCTYKIQLTSSNDIEILVYGTEGLLKIRLGIDRQTGRLDGWDWDSNTRCQMTCTSQFETTKYVDWPKAILRYAEREVGLEEARNPASLYTRAKDASTEVTPFRITDLVSDAPNPDKPAIALFGCDRTSYLERTLASLQQNQECSQFDFYYFQDRPVIGSTEGDRLVEEHCSLVKSKFPRAVIIQRPVNWGCGRNLIDGRRQLFDNLGYDRVYVFEDDMVITPHYIKFCEDVWKWAEESGYMDIGTVQGWSQCRINESERHKFYDHAVEATLDTFWGYSISLKAWDRIRDDLYRYEEKYLNCEYQRRDHDAISAYIRRAYQTYGRRENGLNLYPDTSKFLQTAETYFNGAPTGQDGVTNLLLYTSGFTRLAPVVSRAKYIGEVGLNFTPEKYRAQGYAAMSWTDLDGPDTMRRAFLETLDETPGVTSVKSLADLKI